jgi:hypothetical protein
MVQYNQSSAVDALDSISCVSFGYREPQDVRPNRIEMHSLNIRLMRTDPFVLLNSDEIPTKFRRARRQVHLPHCTFATS